MLDDTTVSYRYEISLYKRTQQANESIHTTAEHNLKYFYCECDFFTFKLNPTLK